MNLQKIYYVPGLISAILIPLIFWFYGSQKLKEPIPNVMDIGLPAKHIHSEKCKTSRTCFEPLRNWNYKKIISSCLIVNFLVELGLLYMKLTKNNKKK